MSNKLLIVVDMQNDFIDGALGTKEAVAIVPNVKEKIFEYINNDDYIFFTRDTHYDNYLETQEGKKLPIKHCIKDTTGWQIRKELVDLYTSNKAHFISKVSFVEKTSFGYYGWALNFEKINFDCIEIVGLCTDICVISNALILKAIYPEIPIIVDANCCAGTTPENHKAALTTMKICQIDIINEIEANI